MMEIKRVGVVGLGLLGSDIVALVLSRKLKVVAVDVNADARKNLSERISSALEELITHAGFKDEDFAGWEDRLEVGDSFAELAECDFVIESVFEDAEIKKTVFAFELDLDADVSAVDFNLPVDIQSTEDEDEG